MYVRMSSNAAGQEEGAQRRGGAGPRAERGGRGAAHLLRQGLAQRAAQGYVRSLCAFDGILYK